MRSAECGVRSAECGVRSAECGVRSAEWALHTAAEPAVHAAVKIRCPTETTRK